MLEYRIFNVDDNLWFSDWSFSKGLLLTSKINDAMIFNGDNINRCIATLDINFVNREFIKVPA